MKKGKFYIINWVFSYGSASSNRLLAYANSAAKEGVDVHIVALVRLSLKGYTPSEGVAIKGLYPCNISNKVIAALLSFFSTLWFLLFKVKKDDRILLYGSADFLPLFILTRRKQLYFEVTECPDLFPPVLYPFCLYKQLWKYVNGVFVISDNLKQYFIEKGVSPDKISIINMIVDSTRFNNVTKSTQEKYVAYCGNVNKDNKDGVYDLIKAFARYHEVYNDRKLYIIGPIYSQEEKNKYIDYLRLSCIEDSVVFTDSVSPTIIPQLFVDSEMLVLARPSNIQAKYGFATKIGEYLLSGRPCVLTDVGNVTDFLTDNVNAYIAVPGNIDSIAKRMIEVSRDSTKAEEIGRAGKQTALLNFNSNIETKKIIFTIYKI